MKTLPILFFLFVSMVPFGAWCQPATTPAQKIRRLEDLERTAIVTRDTATLFRLWSPDYVDNNPNSMVLNAAQLKGMIRRGGIDSTSFTKDIERLTFIKDIAIVMGTETVAPKNKFDNGGKNTTRRYTNIWIKTDTTWQLCARQATNIP